MYSIILLHYTPFMCDKYCIWNKHLINIVFNVSYLLVLKIITTLLYEIYNSQ